MLTASFLFYVEAQFLFLFSIKIPRYLHASSMLFSAPFYRITSMLLQVSSYSTRKFPRILYHKGGHMLDRSFIPNAIVLFLWVASFAIPMSKQHVPDIYTFVFALV